MTMLDISKHCEILKDPCPSKSYQYYSMDKINSYITHIYIYIYIERERERPTTQFNYIF